MNQVTRLAISVGLLLLGAVLMALWQGVFSAGFSYSDEGPHFLNAFFFVDYAKHHLGENPMAVAMDFYLHYPKLAVGHWPPVGHGLISLPFLILPRTTGIAMAINTVMAILPALYIIHVLATRASFAWLLLACAAWAILPINQFAYRYLMIDQLLAFVILAATVAWVRYGETPTLRWALGFGALAGAALLIKGNGAVLALVPVLHSLFTRRVAALAGNRYTYVAAALPVLVAAPWYAYTYSIPAKGMTYHAGVDYALFALVTNGNTLVNNLGIPGVIFLLAGIADGWFERRRNPDLWLWVSASLAVLLAVLIFHAIVPIALDERYLSTALPPAVVLAILGARAVATRCGRWLPLPAAKALAGALLLASVVPGLVQLDRAGKKLDLRMREAAEAIAEQGGPAIWAIDGGTGSAPEGALAAELASIDESQSIYLMPGSKAFTDSDFLGEKYRAKYSNIGDVLALLRKVGVQGVVICRRDGNPDDSVNDILLTALRSPGSGYRLREDLPHFHRRGNTQVYLAESKIQPNVEVLKSINVPRISAKAAPGAESIDSGAR